MCGIAGRIGPDAPGEDRRMLARLEHRGPDDRGEVRFAGGWLGHRRLAIVDVDGGHQPLRSFDSPRWLVGNGEIYNHQEVRRALGENRYATESDNTPSAVAESSGEAGFVSAARPVQRLDADRVASRDE